TALAVVPMVVSPLDLATALPGMLADWEIMWRMLVMVVFATVFAVVAWNVYQKVLGPSRAAVLYTLEPVFAAGFSLLLGHEGLSLTLLVGGGLIVVANLYCELTTQKGERRERREPEMRQREADATTSLLL